MVTGMNARRSPLSFLAFGLALVGGSVVSTPAHADEPVATELPTHVRVHIESPKPVQLEGRAPGQKPWSVACDVPCDRELPLADEYRFGDGPAFRLSPMGGSVLLKVRPASVTGNAGGVVLVGVGVVLAVVGAVGVVVGLNAASQPPPTCGDQSSYLCGAGPGLGKALALLSVIPLLGGVGMAAGGATLLSDSKASTTQRPWSGREPTWVGPQSSTSKKGLSVPLSFAF
jgi:hypothetical protein